MIQASRENFDLSVFCRANLPGVEVHPVPEARSSRVIGTVPFLRRLRDWNTYLANTHFDKYVANRLNGSDVFQGVTGQCLESLKVARAHKTRTLLDVVTTHIDDFGAQQDRECAKFQVRPAIHNKHRQRVREEYQCADLIRVMSNTARQTFLERGISADRLAVIPPPVNVDDFPEAHFLEPKFRISFVGLIEPWKGFHYLIDAFKSLNLPDSELILWGGTGSRPVNQYLQAQMALNPNIIVKPVEVRRFGYGEVYAKSSVLVHPSLADGFGYAVAEAMASGIPVIVTSNTGAADIVVDGVNGYVVPPANSDAIRERLAHLAANPALVREMGRSARAATSSLTFNRFRERYQSSLNALAA